MIAMTTWAALEDIFPISGSLEPVPKLVDYALKRMVLGQALAVFQVFSLAKLRNLRLLSQKLKFWESPLLLYPLSRLYVYV
jgi:hypothetical protein